MPEAQPKHPSPPAEIEVARTAKALASSLSAATSSAREHAAACLAASRRLPPGERSSLLRQVARSAELADTLVRLQAALIGDRSSER